jgi:hypothetical protein
MKGEAEDVKGSSEPRSGEAERVTGAVCFYNRGAAEAVRAREKSRKWEEEVLR